MPKTVPVNDSTRLKCPIELCSKTFINDKTLKNHISKYHPNSFFNNNNLFELNKNVVNPSENIQFLNFLNDFNLSYNNSSLNTSTNSSINSENNTDFSFEKKVSSHLKNNLNFVISLLNINSLLYKYASIKFILDQGLTDILVINETRLDLNRCDNEFFHPKYNMFRRDRLTDSGGGIMVYVNKAYIIHSINYSESIEVINFSINFNKKNIAFIAAYRPPYLKNEVNFFNNLRTVISNLEKNHKEIILIGDLNYDMFIKEKNTLVAFCKTHGFKNTNKTVGTRLNQAKNEWSLLDVILCFQIKSLINVSVFPCPFSDHDLVVNMFNFKKSYTKKSSFLARSFNKVNCEEIKNSLSRILEEFKYDHDNVTTHWEVLKGLITSVIDKHSPLKSITPKSHVNVPWFDKTLVSLARIRDKAYNKAIKTSKNPNSNSELIKNEFNEFIRL